MNLKKLFLFFISILLLTGCSTKKKLDQYSIVKGMNKKDVLNIHKHYDLLVINADNYSSHDIELLHKNVSKIYAYIDIGATSNKKYENIYVKPTISGKKNYVNINNQTWQSDIYQKVDTFKKIGIDGFFLDHIDLYDIDSQYYDGLLTIIKNIHHPIMLNNAMNFIEKDVSSIKKYVQSIHHENVFTYWNHQTHKREDVDKTLNTNTKIYLEDMKKEGFEIYIVDFTKKSDWQAVIKAYCKNNDFHYYFAPDTSYKKIV